MKRTATFGRNVALGAVGLLVLAPAALAQRTPTSPRPSRSPTTSLYRDLSGGMVRPPVANTGLPASVYGPGNAVVTGNVFAGRGFRGSVGYGAADDFRGATGSDDISRFLSESAMSAPAFFSGGDSTYTQVRYGAGLSMLEYRRPSSVASAGDLAVPVDSGASWGMMDQQRTVDAVARATSAEFALRRNAEPIAAGDWQSPDGVPLRVDLSALSGVRVEPAARDFRQFDLTTLDRLAYSRDVGAGLGAEIPGRPFEAGYADLPIGSEDETDPATGTGRGATPPSLVASPLVAPSLAEGSARAPSLATRTFREIQSDIATRYARATEAETPDDRAAAATNLERDLEILRLALTPGEELPIDDPRRIEVERLRAQLRGETEPPAPGDEAEEGVSMEELLGSVLRHGRRIEGLGGADSSRIGELMAEGEAAMRAGSYFRAERAFTRVVRFSPGHPVGTAGLAHAQIGAGLYLSASLTLRGLFTNQPEMIDVRYGPEARPSDARLAECAADLRQRIVEGKHPLADGFLLAYVGHLLGDRAQIEAGLAAMESVDDGRPMGELLRGIWLRVP